MDRLTRLRNGACNLLRLIAPRAHHPERNPLRGARTDAGDAAMPAETVMAALGVIAFAALAAFAGRRTTRALGAMLAVVVFLTAALTPPPVQASRKLWTRCGCEPPCPPP